MCLSQQSISGKKLVAATQTHVTDRPGFERTDSLPLLSFSTNDLQARRSTVFCGPIMPPTPPALSSPATPILFASNLQRDTSNAGQRTESRRHRHGWPVFTTANTATWSRNVTQYTSTKSDAEVDRMSEPISDRPVLPIMIDVLPLFIRWSWLRSLESFTINSNWISVTHRENALSAIGSLKYVDYYKQAWL